MAHGKPKFQIGQQVRHKLFHYAGVIVGVDPIFNKPWYHVAVTGGHGATQTYVTEQNLEPNNDLNN